MKLNTIALRLVVATSMLTLLGSAASADQKVPDATVQEILIKTSLLTFNDANVTGNYEVLHARLAKPFADKFSAQQLADTFKGFHDRHVYLDLIAAKTPVTESATVDNTGRLAIKGYFDTSPSRVYYDLAYILAGDEWQLMQLTVNLKKPDGK